MRTLTNYFVDEPRELRQIKDHGCKDLVETHPSVLFLVYIACSGEIFSKKRNEKCPDIIGNGTCGCALPKALMPRFLVLCRCLGLFAAFRKPSWCVSAQKLCQSNVRTATKYKQI